MYIDAFIHGLMHPLLGLDHLLTMVAVGLLAVSLGRRAVWQLPISFVLLMTVGGVLGYEGVRLPHVEILISASVAAMGLLIVSRQRPSRTIAIVLVAIFGVFHGHAHAVEMSTVAAAANAAGFTLVTILLHGAGIGLGFLVYSRGSIETLENLNIPTS